MCVLYLGSDPERFRAQRKQRIIHFPLLEVVPRSLHSTAMAHILDDLPNYTHSIFTSKSTVWILRQHLRALKNIFAIGKSTAAALEKEGVVPTWVAKEETQEGIIEHLRLFDWNEESYVFLPRSALARSALENFLILQQIRHQVCDLYDMQIKSIAPPSLDNIEEIVFTSPSTVNAFRQFFPHPPVEQRLTPIGPITAEALRSYTNNTQFTAASLP